MAQSSHERAPFSSLCPGLDSRATGVLSILFLVLAQQVSLAFLSSSAKTNIPNFGATLLFLLLLSCIYLFFKSMTKIVC